MAKRGGRSKSGEQVVVRSAEFIGWALGGLEREIAQTRQRLNGLLDQAKVLQTQYRKAAGNAAGAVSKAAGKVRVAKKAGTRRRMSAEARRRISEAMKKRWAARKRQD